MCASQQQIGSALKVFNINKNHAFIWVPHVCNLITNQTIVTTNSWLSTVLDIMLQSELLDSSRLHYSWRSQQPNWKYRCRWVVFTLSTMWPARCIWHDTPQDRAYGGTMFVCEVDTQLQVFLLIGNNYLGLFWVVYRWVLTRHLVLQQWQITLFPALPCVFSSVCLVNNTLKRKRVEIEKAWEQLSCWWYQGDVR